MTQMDFFSSYFNQPICVLLLLAIITSILVISIYTSKTKNKNKNKRSPPQPPGSWPLIGHLHLLAGSNSRLHRTLASMADTYGPAFSIRLGVHEALVVSNWEVAKDCFTAKNDKIFSTRPRSLAVKLMGYDHVMFGMAPYGPYWRHMRKLATVELLSSHRLEALRHVRDAEINHFIRELYENSGSANLVEMKERFGDLATNITVRVVAGKRYGGDDNVESRVCQRALGKFFKFVGMLMASDFVPLMGWLDWVRGYVGEMKRTAKELDGVFSRWVDEHRRKRRSGKVGVGEQDFIHVMISVMENDANHDDDDNEDGWIVSEHDVDTVIKGTCLSLILGGNDTTVITLTWALSLMLNNRHTLQRAQDELDIHVGRHRQVDESDIKNLVYLQAVVKETLRLYPALPLSAARIATEDCTVAGFHIPAGTHLLVNLWKLQRDPTIWSDPVEFKPERFLKDHANLDFRGKNFEYIPFGSGRRSCPGITFGLLVMHLTLARLLHGFELDTVSGTPVDMSETSGLTNPKATPLEVKLTPRLPSELYGC